MKTALGHEKIRDLGCFLRSSIVSRISSTHKDKKAFPQKPTRNPFSSEGRMNGLILPGPPRRADFSFFRVLPD